MHGLVEISSSLRSMWPGHEEAQISDTNRRGPLFSSLFVRVLHGDCFQSGGAEVQFQP